MNAHKGFYQEELCEEQEEEQQLQPEEQYKSLCFIIKAACVYCLSSLYFGYSMSYFNSVPYQVLQNFYQIHVSGGFGEGLLSGAVAFGGIFGAVSQRKVLETFGRKHCFYFTNGLAIVAGLIVLMPNVELLLVGRILQGIIVGVMSGIIPIMIKQFSPISVSGTMGALPNFFISLGFLLSFLFSSIFQVLLHPHTYVPLVFGFPLLIIVVQQLTLMTILTNETPKYLLLNGRNQEAKELISKIYREEIQETIYLQKLRDLDSEHPQFQSLAKDLPQDSPRAKFFAIFLAIFQQLTGISIIGLYGAEIAEGFFPALKEELPILIQLQKIIIGSLGLVLLNSYGRRFLMQLGLGLILVSLSGMTIGFWIIKTEEWAKILILLCLTLYIMAFVVTIGPIMWLYIPQITQPNVVPFVITCYWTTCCLVITLFPIFESTCGRKDCPQIFLFFTVCVSICLIVVNLMMVETKGKTELNIRQEFNMQTFFSSS